VALFLFGYSADQITKNSATTQKQVFRMVALFSLVTKSLNDCGLTHARLE
jgi:hypothetical protein